MFKTIYPRVKFRHIDQPHLINCPALCFWPYLAISFKHYSCFHGCLLSVTSFGQQYLHKMQTIAIWSFFSFAFVQQMCCLPAKLLLNLMVASQIYHLPYTIWLELQSQVQLQTSNPLTNQIQESTNSTQTNINLHCTSHCDFSILSSKTHYLTHSLNTRSPDRRLLNHRPPRICQEYTDTNTLPPVNTPSIPWPFLQQWWDEWLKPKYKKRRMSSVAVQVIRLYKHWP